MPIFKLLPNQKLAVRFPYAEDLVQAIKQLPERRWNRTDECWEIPLSYLEEVCRVLDHPLDAVPASIRQVYDESGGGAVKVTVGNAFSRVTGPDLPMEVLDEATSFWVNGAEFSKLYQDGKWDGYRRLMSRRGGISIPTGLLSKVEKVLLESGLEFQIIDERNPPSNGNPLSTDGPSLRDYQENVLSRVEKNERGVLQLATGAGKTLLGAHIAARLGLRTLFFVHTKDLLYQTIRVFQEVLDLPIGQIGDGRVAIQQVTVATIQTTARALNIKIEKEKTDEIPLWEDEAAGELSVTDFEAISNLVEACETVLFDECHHIPADSFYQIAMKLENAYFRYGLSATPWRSDRSDLMIEAALGPKLCVVTSSDLIEKGFLVKPRITMYEMLPTGRRLRRRYATVYKNEVVEHPERNRIIAEVARHAATRGKSALILVNQVRHGEILEKSIEGSVFIHGKDSSEVRNEALHRLREKKDRILIATTLADEGLDLPSLDLLILAGAGKSETRALQRVGRVIRPYPGKETATIVDFWDQTIYLEEHSRQRFEIYQTESQFEVEIRPPKDPLFKSQSRQKVLAER